MRFLFILDRHARALDAVIQELGVSDIEIIAVSKRDRTIATPLLERLIKTQTAVGLCEIDRSYRKSLGNLTFSLCRKAFRSDDAILREWLKPPPPAPTAESPAPSASFLNASSIQPRLILADGALDRADEIPEHRWLFVSKSASLLARYAGGEAMGDMRNWEHLHGVDFAATGKVIHVYKLPGQHKATKTQWHLKQGDKTSAISAARIYFDSCSGNGEMHTIVFYVGPHPPDGQYEPKFSSAQWVKRES